jgi:hypothetical protein
MRLIFEVTYFMVYVSGCVSVRVSSVITKEDNKYHVNDGFEVLTAMNIKITVFRVLNAVHFGDNLKFLYNHFARTTQKTQPLYCWEGVFIEPLHSNGSYSIVAFIFVAAGMFLPSRSIAVNVYSDFTIPAFRRHVTIFNVTQFEDQVMCMIFCWGRLLLPRSQ